jgi:hypothetical protein
MFGLNMPMRSKVLINLKKEIKLRTESNRSIVKKTDSSAV